MEFGITLMMLSYCLGAILLYYLFHESGFIPRVLSLWGLVAVSLVLTGALFAISGYEVPFFVNLAYAPVELTIAVWILAKVTSDTSETKQ